MSIEFKDLGNIESFYSGFDEGYEPSDDIEFPRRLNLAAIDNIEFDQVDHNDYPDFTDAYVSSADMNGMPMNDEELDTLNDQYREFVYQKLIDKLY